MSSNLPAITQSVTITGQQKVTLDGSNLYRGLFIGGSGGSTVSATISNLTISNTSVVGTAGGNDMNGGGAGGGGAGVGGALFVSDKATVTLSNVRLLTNSATGGAGGSGGDGTDPDGSDNGASGGTDIFGNQASGGSSDFVGSSGNTGGTGGGGGGGGYGKECLPGHPCFPNQHGKGGAGGTGGVGGGGGGGGAGNLQGGSGGASGLGGGAGAGGGILGDKGGAGGGGAGLGGAIFVQEGGKLTLAGALTIQGNSVSGGAAGTPGVSGAGTGGLGFGSGIFLQGSNGTLTFNPGSGQTQTVSDVIADQSSSSLVKDGAGTLTLTGVNTYQGGTTVKAGLINFSAANNFGAGNVMLDGGGLQWATGKITDISNKLAPLGANGGTLDTNGNNVTLTSTITGNGGLTKTGAGTLTLAGVNDYTGDTTVVGGLVEFFSPANNFGTGKITLNGGGLKWATGTSADISPILNSLGANGGTFDTNGNNVTLASRIAGAGGLTKSGTGTLTLTGANSYTGGTTVTGGTLQLGTGGSLASTGALTLNSGTFDLNGNNQTVGALSGLTGSTVMLGNGTLTTSSTSNTILSSTITGAGRLIKSGTGTLTLTGTNTYSGGTTINGGTVAVSADNNLGNATGGLTFGGGTLQTTASVSTSRTTMLNGGGGTFNTDAGTTLSHSGTISGSGDLTKSGAGTLTLSGANTYSRGTTINGGTVAVSADNNLGNAAGGLTFGGGTLQTSASVSTSRTTMLNGGGGTFNTDAGTTLSHSGTISGLGGLTKAGAGTLTLSGANTYSGETIVSAGTLRAGAAKSLAAASVFDIGATGILEIGASQTIGLLAGAGSVRSSVAGAVLTVGGNRFANYGGTLQDGTGTLALVKTGTGTLTLTGANTYTGSTTVSGGMLEAAAANSLSEASAFTIGAAGTLQLDSSQTIGSLAGSGTVQSSVTGAVLTAGGDNSSTTFAGTLVDGPSGFGGTLALVKTGTGTLTLTGANTYTGGTTVSGGTLLAGAASTLSMQSAFTVGGAGTLVLGASQTIGSLAGSGTVQSGGAGAVLTAGGDSSSTTFAGTLRDGGIGVPLALVKTGTGTLELTGANTYTGSTTVSAGTLRAGATNSLSMQSAFTIGGAGTLVLGVNQMIGSLAGSGTVRAGDNFTPATVQLTVGGDNSSTDFAGTLRDGPTMELRGTTPLALVKTGTGTLTLSGGNNAYTGGTTVSGGTLQAFNIQGNVVNNANVVFLPPPGGGLPTSYAGVMSGAGTVTVATGANLVMTGVNTYIGPTTVRGGAILNLGPTKALGPTSSLLSDVVAEANSVVLGYGTFLGGFTNNGGTIAPGGSIGTVTIAGNLTLGAGSVYQAETNAAGQSDRINVGGTATLNGTVLAQPEAGVYAPSTTYTILNAAGGIIGTYTSVSSTLPFLQASLGYDANNVFLTLRPGGFGAGAATANQAAVGRVLDASVADSSGDLATVIGTMATYTLAQGQAAMNAISGQNYSGFGTANLGGGLLFMNTLGQQMGLARGGFGGGTRVALAQACEASLEACDGEPSPWSLWGSALGGTGSVAGNANAATLTYNAGGVATGFDYRFDPRFLAGFGVGFSSGNQWASGFSGQGTTNSYQASLYASFTQGAFYLDGLAGYGYNDNQMTRQIVLPNLAARTAQGRTGANQFLAQVEAGYRIGIYEPAALSITPFARFQGMTNSQNGFSESGAGALNLNVAPQTTGSARSVLGAEFAGAFGPEGREKLAVQMRLGWAHEYANTARPVTASFAGAPGANFTVFGAAPQTDSAVFSLAASTAVAQGVSLFARYDGEVGNGISSHALNGGLRVSW